MTDIVPYVTISRQVVGGVNMVVRGIGDLVGEVVTAC